MSQETKPNKYGIPFLTSKEIRDSFLKFYESRNHKFVRSAPVFPHDDPTLLFTNSGMNQFKAIFLGENPGGLKRVTNSQKCLRVSGKHNDLDEVGRDNYHHTFFEMLGHWSFGDYYKKEAIAWAWELLTEVWKLPKDRLYATIYKDDEESEKLWKEITDIEHHRIMRFDKDNFWEMGAVGPCGPCTEIHFDLGDESTREQTYNDKVEGVNGENHRYVELFNCVFIQNERLADGSLIPLKEKHVDTGAGFERICSVIQGTGSNYETDVFTPIINEIAELSNTPYSADDSGTPHRVIADHLRALSFAIADGATPGNEGRGYVLRRILRRASKFAHSIGQKEPFIFKLVDVLAETMSGAFPEISERKSYIKQVIEAEEARFLRTLGSGLERIAKMVKVTKKKKQDTISGEDAFLLSDTFGFPLDLTELIAEENGLKIDSKGYDACMEEQRERARSATKFSDQFNSDENWTVLHDSKDTEFLGYSEEHTGNVKVLRYLEEGEYIFVVLDKTPFYAESGGQVGDIGKLKNADLTLDVVDVQKVLDMTIHKCELNQGLISKENIESFDATVDSTNRARIRRNHSATHLLHSALKNVLGDHVAQQGSLVDAFRLRFDFTHHQGVTDQELKAIEGWVNLQIQTNHAIQTDVMSFDDAKEQGATALFGEKYGDTVRVLTMGPDSKELCGGTHAESTGQIGLFKITSESSVAAGIRRIEAVSGMGALELFDRDAGIISKLSLSLKTKANDLVEKITDLSQKNRAYEKEIKQLRQAQAQLALKTFVDSNKIEISGSSRSMIIGKLDNSMFGKDDLQFVLDTLSAEQNDSVAVLTHIAGDQLSIMATVGKNCKGQANASNLVKELSQIAGGRGGGRPDKARGGAKELDKEPEVLKKAKDQVESLLKG